MLFSGNHVADLQNKLLGFVVVPYKILEQINQELSIKKFNVQASGTSLSSARTAFDCADVKTLHFVMQTFEY
jgi:hypothetical protein